MIPTGNDSFHVIQKPLNVMELVKQRSEFGQVDDAPIHILNISDIVRKYQIWEQHLARVIPFYAVKCNDIPIIIQTLARLGIGFDCASKGEISKVMSCGVNAESIIFANPSKPISHFNYASARNIKLMTVDCHEELEKIKTHYPDANLVVRIRCDAKVSLCELGDKFGCDPNTEAEQLIQTAKSLGLIVKGISFHVGSGCMEPPAFARAIHAARKLFDFAKGVGFQFNLLDIGGGFPGETGTSIKEIASVINESLDLYFPSEDVTIIAEPGRYFVASASTLVCQVHSIRKVHRDGQIQSIMYFINDGVHGSFNMVHRGMYSLNPITLKESKKTVPSTIWGPTCDSIDWVCQNVALPLLDVNDFIVFENMGAYTLPLISCFNGLPLPKIQFIIEKKHLEILKDLTIVYKRDENQSKIVGLDAFQNLSNLITPKISEF